MKYVLICEYPDLTTSTLGYFNNEQDAKDAVDFLNHADEMCSPEIAEEYENMLCDTDDRIDEAMFVKEHHPEITIEALSLGYKYYILQDTPIYYYTPIKQKTLNEIINETVQSNTGRA